MSVSISRRGAAAVCAAALFAGSPAGAAPIYWDGTGTSWNVPANWSTDPAATTPDPAAVPGANDVATFNITGLNTAQTVSLDANQAAQGLNNLSTGTVTLQGGGVNRPLALGASGITSAAGTTRLNVGSGTANQNVNVSLTADQSWQYNGANNAGQGIIVNNAVSLGVAGDHTLTLGGSTGSTAISGISGAVSDGGADRVLNLTLNGASANRWNLNGNNAYTGLTTITSGALGITTATALGGTTNGTDVASGAALFLRGTSVTHAAEPITIRGAGPSASARGALRNVTGTNTWTGPVTAVATAANVRIGADSGSLTFSPTATIAVTGANALDFEATGDILVNSNITGGMPVNKILGGGTGLGILTLAGANNSYTGATTVNVGVLRVNGALTATSAVSIAAGAALQGNNGTINTAATTTVNGTLAPGATTTPVLGTLSTGPLTLTSTSTFAADVNTAAPAAADLVNVAGNLTLAADNTATLTLNDLGGDAALPPGTAYTLIDYTGAWNGGLFRVGGNVIADDTGSFALGQNTYRIDYNGGPNNNDVVLSVAVPEPGTTGLISLATGALLARRRRRRTA
jgi:autotransporter-associated beta strand protein